MEAIQSLRQLPDETCSKSNTEILAEAHFIFD